MMLPVDVFRVTTSLSQSNTLLQDSPILSRLQCHNHPVQVAKWSLNSKYWVEILWVFLALCCQVFRGFFSRQSHNLAAKLLFCNFREGRGVGQNNRRGLVFRTKCYCLSPRILGLCWDVDENLQTIPILGKNGQIRTVSLLYLHKLSKCWRSTN